MRLRRTARPVLLGAMTCLALSVGTPVATSAAPTAAAAPATAAVPAAPAGPLAAASEPRAGATISRIKIMPLGDSITAGVGSTTGSSYRADLYQRLTRAGLPVNFVGSQHAGSGTDIDHEGHGGWTIDRIAAELDGWLTASTPDAVLVHLGTNNITRGEAPADVAAKLGALLDQIRTARPLAHIFVSKIIMSKVRAEIPADVAYNALIPGVVAARDARVHLVDHSRVGGIDLLDLHHPNDFGYAKMAYTWYRALERVYNTSGPAWTAGVNPFALRRTYRKLWRPVIRDGQRRSSYYSGYWHRRDIGGVEHWQTQRKVTERYTTRVDGRTVTRTRTVLRWRGPAEFLAF